MKNSSRSSTNRIKSSANIRKSRHFGRSKTCKGRFFNGGRPESTRSSSGKESNGWANPTKVEGQMVGVSEVEFRWGTSKFCNNWLWTKEFQKIVKIVLDIFEGQTLQRWGFDGRRPNSSNKSSSKSGSKSGSNCSASSKRQQEHKQQEAQTCTFECPGASNKIAREDPRERKRAKMEAGERNLGGPAEGGPEGWGSPKFRACFSLSCHNFHFLPLWGVFSWNFGGVFDSGTLKCARLGSLALV